MKVSDLFEVKYGHNLEEMRCVPTDGAAGVLFVSCSGRNNGVVARVLAHPGVTPGEPGQLTVACNGTVMSTFVQTEKFYTGRDVYILTPKDPTMSLAERLWWAACLRSNDFRYGYGRKANRTLASLTLPDVAPEWVADAVQTAANGLLSAVKSASTLTSRTRAAKPAATRQLTVSELFDIKFGHRLDLNKLRIAEPGDEWANFISRTEKNNGVLARVSTQDGRKPFEPGLITVATVGSVCSAFVQTERFYTAQNVSVLTPKRPMNLVEKLWWCRCIRENRYRYNYGRAANRTLAGLHLPGELPEWVVDAAKDAATSQARAVEAAIAAAGVTL